MFSFKNKERNLCPMQNRIKSVFYQQNLTLGSASRYSQNQSKRKKLKNARKRERGFQCMLTPFVFPFVRFPKFRRNQK